ncbi:unnamed protein product [Hermetia illucens]|uniref:Coiled-coil domain-containing protein 12 n=1 Tax=Hermetia illucens TaxID=343691 RepID=A0A7R8UQP5_HERIL|nr:coiled-coil domain-containing protein 12 [Hermetia illucens]CAD7085251.1 unnamed protein product [Hermetia illucens]
MTMEPEGGSLEAESLKRKERLRNLRKRAAADQESEEGDSPDEQKPVFRSYAPQDKSIGDVDTKKGNYMNYIEEEVKEQIESSSTPILTEEVDIINLAPRKADWDLKRDVARKLSKLERITQKAVAELIRERMKNNDVDIFQAVNISTSIRKD